MANDSTILVEIQLFKDSDKIKKHMNCKLTTYKSYYIEYYYVHIMHI